MFKSPFESKQETQPPTINPIDDFYAISGNQEAIILFELFPLSRAKELNIFTKDKYGKEIFTSEERFAKGVFQATQDFVEIGDIPSIANVEKIRIQVTYHFGEYMEIIFICLFKRYYFKDLNTPNPDIGQRRHYMEYLQKEIERWISVGFHGFFYKNDLNIFNREFSMPSIHVYSAHNFAIHLADRPTDEFVIGCSTSRSKAKWFVSEFRTGS